MSFKERSAWHGSIPCQKRCDGIDIRPNDRADGVAHLAHRLRVVADEAGVHLEGNADIVLLGVCTRLFPIGNSDGVPLPVKDFQEVRRPGASHPIRIFRPLGVAGATGEADNGLKVELLGERDALAVDGVALLRLRFVRVQRVAVAGERGDFQTARRKERLVVAHFAVVFQESVYVDVRRAGIAPGADLDGGAARLSDKIEHFLNRLLGKERVEDSDFHAVLPSIAATLHA